MHTKFERLLSKSLTTLEVMTHYLVVHTGPGSNPSSPSTPPPFPHPPSPFSPPPSTPPPQPTETHLSADPSVWFVTDREVVQFHLVSLPDHAITADPPSPDTDPQRQADGVVTSRIRWRTSDSDTGDFIIQVVAVDSYGCVTVVRFCPNGAGKYRGPV